MQQACALSYLVLVLFLFDNDLLFRSSYLSQPLDGCSLDLLLQTQHLDLLLTLVLQHSLVSELQPSSLEFGHGFDLVLAHLILSGPLL